LFCFCFNHYRFAKMISVRMVACLLLLGVSVVICADFDDTPSLVPMFLWSKYNYFTAHYTVSESLQSSDVTSLLATLVSHKNDHKNKINSYINKADSPPEALIAFVYPQLSSSDASRIAGGYSSTPPSSFLQTALTSSRTSLSLPYILTHNSLRNDIINVISSNSPHSVLFASSDIDVTDKLLMGCDALLNHLQEDPTIFSNRITDLILIPYDHTKDSANCMDRLIAHVDDKSKGRFVALVTAEQSSTKPIQMVFSDGTESSHFSKSSLSFTEFAIDTKPGKFRVASTALAVVVYPGVVFVTPNTIFALFLAFFMVFIIYTGATCVMYIETPVRFSTTSLQLAKEY